MAQQNLDIVVRVRGGTVASTEIKGVGGAIQGVGTQSEQTSKKTRTLGNSLKGLATGFAVYKGYQWIKGAVDQTTNLAKSTAALHRITGLDTQAAAGWVTTAQERGIQSKQLNQAFITLSKGIEGAAQGSKAGKLAFSQLGLDATNLKVQDARTQLGMIADSFRALPPGVDKAALAQKLFGRQAQAMLPIINQGAGALNKQIDEMGKSSGMTDKNAKSALNLVRQQRELEHAMLGVKVAIGTALTPVLVAATKVLTPMAQAFSHLMQTSPAFRVAIYALVGALTAMLVVTRALALASITLEGAWLLIPAAIGAIAVGLIYLYMKCAWFRDAVNGAFSAIKNVAVAAFDFIKAHWVLLVALIPGIGPIIALVIKNFDTLKGIAVTVFGAIKGAAQTAANILTSVFGGAWSAVGGIVKQVAGTISGIWDTMSKIIHAPGKVAGIIGKGLSAIGLQHGGTVTHPGMAVVGEAGPELVHLPTGAQVIPNYALPSGGGGGHVTVPVYLDRRQIALAFGDFTADQQAAR